MLTFSNSFAQIAIYFLAAFGLRSLLESAYRAYLKITVKPVKPTSAEFKLALIDKIEAAPAVYKRVIAEAAPFADDEIVKERSMCANFNFSRARRSFRDRDFEDANKAIGIVTSSLQEISERVAELSFSAASAALLA